MATKSNINIDRKGHLKQMQLQHFTSKAAWLQREFRNFLDVIQCQGVICWDEFMSHPCISYRTVFTFVFAVSYVDLAGAAHCSCLQCQRFTTASHSMERFGSLNSVYTWIKSLVELTCCDIMKCQCLVSFLCIRTGILQVCFANLKHIMGWAHDEGILIQSGIPLEDECVELLFNAAEQRITRWLSMLFSKKDSHSW